MPSLAEDLILEAKGELEKLEAKVFADIMIVTYEILKLVAGIATRSLGV